MVVVVEVVALAVAVEEKMMMTSNKQGQCDLSDI